MQVLVNGTAFDLPERSTIDQLLHMRELDPRYVVVERNGEPLPRDCYDVLMLEEGDRLELVRAVAGG